MPLAKSIFCIMMSGAAAAQPSTGAQLAGWAGDWAISDAAGRQVGNSRIVEQVPGTMLYELRTVGEGKPQWLWFENAERNDGWTQLFVAPTGMTREFKPWSRPGEWPIMMGADIVLQDGRAVRFRMTISQIPQGGYRRHLERSADAGATWSTVFDYRYRRAA